MSASGEDGPFARSEIEREALANQLNASLETMPDGFLLLDREWRFTFVNRQAEALLQRPRARLLGKSMWAEFPEGVDTVAYAEYSKVMEGGGSTTFELDYPPLGKRLEVRAFGSPYGLAVYFRDITAKHKTDEMMRLLQTAVSRLHDMVMIAEGPISGDPPPRVVFVNPAFERRTGYAAAEMLGRSPRFLQGENTDQSEVLRLRQALLDGERGVGELIYYTKAGEELWLEIDIAPMPFAEFGKTYVVAIMRDITERKQVEMALRESIERFRIVSQATADVVWDWNLLEDLMWWSDGMETSFGYGADGRELGVASWSVHLHPNDRERVVAGIHDVIDSGGHKWSDEYRFIRADGSIAQVLDRGFVIRDGDGRAIRMVGSMIDVTKQRELEAQLRQSQRLEAVGQLTGGVAHDFNNLLTVILSNAELLESRLAADPKLHTLAQMTRRAAERGAELTSRLLAFSRRQALDPKAVNVNALVTGMQGLLGRALGDHVTIDVVADAHVWPALVDAPQLESAILNLCINARDAMPGGGRITIATLNVTLEAEAESPAGEFIRLSVTDTGTGMDQATAARVFEPFFTTKEVGKGSGLGLSMVYGFVKQSKGRVAIESAPGRGTTVNLYLPRAGAEALANDIAPSDDLPSGHEKVLVVEDDEMVRTQVCGELEALGYRVISVSDGAQALAVLQRARDIDLLFTDVAMPGMNGRELANAARALTPDICVLFTSGHAEEVLTRDGRLEPGVHLLSKPYRRRDLAHKLREALAALPRAQAG